MRLNIESIHLNGPPRHVLKVQVTSVHTIVVEQRKPPKEVDQKARWKLQVHHAQDPIPVVEEDGFFSAYMAIIRGAYVLTEHLRLQTLEAKASNIKVHMDSFQSEIDELTS